MMVVTWVDRTVLFWAVDWVLKLAVGRVVATVDMKVEMMAVGWVGLTVVLKVVS